MKKIAIVSDSSMSFTPEQIKETGVYVAPLTLVYQGKEFIDQVTITNDEVAALLIDNAVITTSQPNLGSVIEIFESLKDKDYDYIICLPLIKHLSGTHSVFLQAAKEVELDNLYIVDTGNLVGPIQQSVYTIIEMNKEGKDIEAILKQVQYICDNSEAYLLPKSLKQLKAGGRISPAAATLASLLKIKAILKFFKKGTTIDKFDTARTDAKAFDIIINDLIKQGVSPATHKLVLLEADAADELAAFMSTLEAKLGTFETTSSRLPSSLVTHAGLGTFAIQYIPNDRVS